MSFKNEYLDSTDLDRLIPKITDVTTKFIPTTQAKPKRIVNIENAAIKLASDIVLERIFSLNVDKIKIILNTLESSIASDNNESIVIRLIDNESTHTGVDNWNIINSLFKINCSQTCSVSSSNMTDIDTFESECVLNQSFKQIFNNTNDILTFYFDNTLFPNTHVQLSFNWLEFIRLLKNKPSNISFEKYLSNNGIAQKVIQIHNIRTLNNQKDISNKNMINLLLKVTSTQNIQNESLDISGLSISHIQRKVKQTFRFNDSWLVHKIVTFTHTSKGIDLINALKIIFSDNRFCKKIDDESFDNRDIEFEYAPLNNTLKVPFSNISTEFINLLVHLTTIFSNDTSLDYNNMVIQNVLKIFNKTKIQQNDYDINVVSNDNLLNEMSRQHTFYINLPSTKYMLAINRVIIYVFANNIYIKHNNSNCIRNNLSYKNEELISNIYIFDAYYNARTKEYIIIDLLSMTNANTGKSMYIEQLTIENKIDLIKAFCNGVSFNESVIKCADFKIINHSAINKFNINSTPNACILTYSNSNQVIIKASNCTFNCYLQQDVSKYTYNIFVRGNVENITHINNTSRVISNMYNKLELIPFTSIFNNQFKSTSFIRLNSSVDEYRNYDNTVCELIWSNNGWLINKVLIDKYESKNNEHVNKIMTIERATKLIRQIFDTNVKTNNVQTDVERNLISYYDTYLQKSFEYSTYNNILHMFHHLDKTINQYIIEKTLPTINISEISKSSLNNTKLYDVKPLSMLYFPTNVKQIKHIYRYTNTKNCYIVHDNITLEKIEDLVRSKCSLIDLIKSYPRRIHNDNISSRSIVNIEHVTSTGTKNIRSNNDNKNDNNDNNTLRDKLINGTVVDMLNLYGLVRDETSIIDKLKLQSTYVNNSIDVVYIENINKTIKDEQDIIWLRDIIEKCLSKSGKIIIGWFDVSLSSENIVKSVDNESFDPGYVNHKMKYLPIAIHGDKYMSMHGKKCGSNTLGNTNIRQFKNNFEFRTIVTKQMLKQMLPNFNLTTCSTPLTEELFAAHISTNRLYTKLNLIEEYMKCYKVLVFERSI